VIAIQDTGIGIPEEQMSKLFQPLFTTKAKGQGLGLTVCKRLVEANDGQITFTSTLGVGSTFTVTLPLIPNPFADKQELPQTIVKKT
jgi:signal transduction histidine kinase